MNELSLLSMLIAIMFVVAFCVGSGETNFSTLRMIPENEAREKRRSEVKDSLIL